MRRSISLSFFLMLAHVGGGFGGTAASESSVAGVSLPSPAPPEPVPPTYTKLKDLHITTELVSRNKANVTIIVSDSGRYEKQARRIQRHIAGLTSVQVPVSSDVSIAASVPIKGNLIVLGNRSTNRTISELYNRYFTLLDLRYPGPGGHVVRTLHNPFGDGSNVVFVGGSDRAGVEAAADTFIAQLSKANISNGTLSIGWLAQIKLGNGVRVPTDLRQFETWEASEGYGSVGYFGWNSISKRMAMYYMTGVPYHAREAIRLAFPDEEARREIAEIDGERIENKQAPLSGPYHYNAHMMILFWDLIEESPVFSDEERLRVTNAFSKQLDHRKAEGIYGRTKPPAGVGSRHGQWSAISLYCLGRYFQRDYAHPIWQHCIESAKLHFQPLHEHAWVSGESDNLFWYNTGIAPVFSYLLLSGDRTPVENGVLRSLLRGQEILISGRRPDWALRSASVGYLHKAAYLMQDGRYIGYRQRTGIDMDVFRLGQSFWPEEHLSRPQPPNDLVDKWSIHYLPEPMWRARDSGLAREESFLFVSFRSAANASGDFILIDGFNGASRNPYHTFAILELRLDGRTLLSGYRNQVLTRADGLVELQIAMDAALKYQDVVGKTATVVAEVPNAAYCNWRRTLAQRRQRYALVVDDLTFRTTSDNLEVQIQWETERAATTSADGQIVFDASSEVGEPRWRSKGQVRTADVMATTCRGRVAAMRWTGPVRNGEHRVFFSLVGSQADDPQASMGCVRLADNAAALVLPGAALAVVGEFQGVKAELAIVAKDHLYAKGLVEITPERHGGPPQTHIKDSLIRFDSPVDVDWDFRSGTLHVSTKEETRGTVALASDVTHSGPNASSVGKRRGATALHLAAGRHVFDAARPPEEHLEELSAYLDANLTEGTRKRSQAIADARLVAQADVPALTPAMSTNVGGAVVDLITVPSDNGGVVAVAEGKRIHLLSPDGQVLRILEADGPIRMLRWWHEHRLLLAGCADEQVIAFDETGQRKWVFTSEMDPAVFRAAKTYWFKSAPGHEGIHGLHTAVFLNGKSQAFVGSACTLEILDENGQLVRRMPQFWGKVSHFVVVDGPGGTLNLLASRKYNGRNRVAIINNKTLNPNPRGFDTVPSGSTYVPGWSSMNRHHLFYEDLDGDGEREVVSEINGTWNRVTVWRADGKALYDASFGPGERIPAKNMRDMEIADLDADGKKEITVATSSGLIVTLDHQCRKRWARHLASPAVVMRCVEPEPSQLPRIVIGCEDGSITMLAGTGKLIRSGAVTGRPTCVDTLCRPAGRPLVLFGTEQGEIKAFDAGQ